MAPTGRKENSVSLINREDLLNAFGLSEKTRKYGGDHSGYDTRMLYEIQDTIEDAAEVEAISVEWILRYINVCEAVSKTCCGTALKLSAEALSVTLDYWREEKK